MGSPRVVVLVGAPGVGKSTVARQLATRRSRCAHVKPDDLHRMIVSGGVWPSEGSEEAHRQLLLRTKNAAAVAGNLLECGFDVVIDEVVATVEQRQVFASIGSAPVVAFVGLTAPAEVIAARDAGRGKHTAHLYRGVEADIRRAADARWLETGDLTVEEVVDLVAELVGW